MSPDVTRFDLIISKPFPLPPILIKTMSHDLTYFDHISFMFDVGAFIHLKSELSNVFWHLMQNPLHLPHVMPYNIPATYRCPYNFRILIPRSNGSTLSQEPFGYCPHHHCTYSITLTLERTLEVNVVLIHRLGVICLVWLWPLEHNKKK